MTSSPSRYRREGHNAYFRGGKAEDFCPYAGLRGSFWVDGWQEAERVDKMRKQVEDEHNTKRSDLACKLVSVFPEWSGFRADEFAELLLELVGSK